MENKQLGTILIIACIVLGFLIFTFNQALLDHADASCSCSAMEDGGMCPHDQPIPWQTYFGIVLISAIAALGVYLIFFEKSQKEIVSALGKQKQMKIDTEKFEILLKGLTAEEKKVVKAVKEQDGITQQTLRLRTGLHKSKLSIVLEGLEKKGIVSRKLKGKTKQVHLKIKL